MSFDISTEINDGIERITYTPHEVQYNTPLLFQHGAFQGAWCWQWWQEEFAKLGWKSHAYSLPGHGNSLAQRPIQLCNLGYYRKFLKAEIERCDTTPIIIAHSMGGGILQRYLKYHGDLPAAVMVGSMLAHGIFLDILKLTMNDPFGALLSSLTLSARPQIRTPEKAAYLFLDDGSLLSPEEFHPQLKNESLIALMQHNSLMWSPPHSIKTPILWLTGEVDVSFAKSREEKSAEFYRATYHMVEGAAHNIMMAANYRETALFIHDWLLKSAL